MLRVAQFKAISSNVAHMTGAVPLICITYEPRHEKTCFCHMRTTKAQISLRIRAVWSAPLLLAARIIEYLIFLNAKFKTLASFCGCAGRFESSLVTNPEDRFSRDKAHIVHDTLRLIFKLNLKQAKKSLWISILLKHLSHITRKPIFASCNQVRLKPACSATETS